MEKNYSYKFDFETLKNDFKNIIEKFNENLSKKKPYKSSKCLYSKSN